MSLRNHRHLAYAVAATVLLAAGGASAGDTPPPPQATGGASSLPAAYPNDALPGEGDLSKETAEYARRDWILHLKTLDAANRATYCQNRFADPTECTATAIQPATDAAKEKPPVAVAPPPARIVVREISGIIPDLEASISIGTDSRRIPVHPKDRLPDGRQIKAITWQGVTMMDGEFIRYTGGR